MCVCVCLRTQEQRLLIILSNCQYLERHTFLNLAEHLEKNGFTSADKIIRVQRDLPTNTHFPFPL